MAMVVRATTYTFRAGPAAIIAAWCSFLVSMPTGSQAIPATPFCETAQYIGCYKNEGGIRVTTHEPAGKTLDECHALAADAGRQHFGLEWPQGFPGTARAQCLALDERQWRSMAKVADAECAGAVPGSLFASEVYMGSAFRLAVYFFGDRAGCRSQQTVKYTHVVGTAGKTFGELTTLADYGSGVGGYIDGNAASPVDGKVVGCVPMRCWY